MRLSAAAYLLVLAPTALAQDKPTDACKDPISQNELTACAWQEAEKADAEMAVAFAKARKAMEAIDKEWPEIESNPASAVEALEQSQRGWLEYRQGSCIIAGFAERGGSMEPMVVGHCHEKVTRARIAELNEWAAE